MIFLILGNSIGYAQLFDGRRKQPYKKVFVETDDFGYFYLDTLQKYYPKAKADSIKFSMLNDLAYYWHTRNLNTALDFTNQGLKLTSNKKNSLWNGRFKITQGAILLRHEMLDSAFAVLEEAKQQVQEEDLAFLNTQLGYVFERRGQLGKAADYALESLRLGRELNNLKAQAMAYSDLSNLFWKQSKFDKGLEFGLKSLLLFEERGITGLDYDFTLYVVGNNYLEQNQFEKALEYFEKSKRIGERYGFYNNLSDVYISLTDLYAYLNEYKKAEEAGANALKYAKLLDNNFMIMRSWLSIGKLQNLKEEYRPAILSLKKSIDVATINFGDEYYLSQAYTALADAYYGSGDFENAFVALKHYERLKNMIFTGEADQRISLLQTEFDTALKEETINRQQTKIAQQQSRQLFFIVIASLLLLLLGLLYKTFQNNKKKNKLLRKQNDEKAFLLKEIHHRVKNNLEIVSSLLALHSAQLKDATAADAMQESQNRVNSMSMIHQRLYQGENLAAIEMKNYFINLSHYVLNTFGMEDRVTIDCNMDSIECDVDTAIPLGLIVNELLTNALKYAFPEKRKGTISINLKQINTQHLKLFVADNGIGTGNETIKGTGFGTQLIKLLTQQIDGTIEDKSNVTGTRITIGFSLDNLD
jgi:two-component sensor histidine kinase